MEKTFFFKNISILMGSNMEVIKDNLLIIDGKIAAFGHKANKEALKNKIEISKSGNKLVAPMLVDSHSYLKNPLTGVADDLANLKLRAKKSGFYIIDNNNELSEVKNILGIKNLFPSKKIVIKNIADSNSFKEIEKANIPTLTTISWWSLLADTNNLELDDLGWKVDPPLGSKENREFLIKALENDLIQAIAVNSIALNDEDTFVPINDRPVGISSFELVLPLLWEEFINIRGWPISKLWKYLSFNPSDLLGIKQEALSLGSKRWLMFDPDIKWVNNQINLGYDSPSNFPKKNKLIKGKVIDVGLDF